MLQGFPVHTKWSYNVPCCSFAQKQVAGMVQQSRSAICTMAGNAMHTSVAGAVWMYVLTQIELNHELAYLLWHNFVEKVELERRRKRRRGS